VLPTNEGHKKPFPPPKNGTNYVVLLAGGVDDMYRQIKQKLWRYRGIEVAYHWLEHSDFQKPLPQDVDFILIVINAIKNPNRLLAVKLATANSVPYIGTTHKWGDLQSRLTLCGVPHSPLYMTAEDLDVQITRPLGAEHPTVKVRRTGKLSVVPMIGGPEGTEWVVDTTPAPLAAEAARISKEHAAQSAPAPTPPAQSQKLSPSEQAEFDRLLREEEEINERKQRLAELQREEQERKKRIALERATEQVQAMKAAAEEDAKRMKELQAMIEKKEAEREERKAAKAAAKAPKKRAARAPEPAPAKPVDEAAIANCRALATELAKQLLKTNIAEINIFRTGPHTVSVEFEESLK
jgi:uncharacterized protein YaaR (DUF327 family)